MLGTVGRLDTLQAAGQLDSLIRSGLRFCEQLAVIDAHAADRQAIVEHLRVQLQQGDKELIGNQGYRKYLQVGPGERFVLRSQLLGQAHKAFMAAGVALPATLREVALIPNPSSQDM